ncbi:MAG: ribonuclease III [Spongiibacteraceae bacterium]|jgi:ribonuclease-3|nr:ribonuclease III [Spongiibacteraceae bacterium]
MELNPERQALLRRLGHPFTDLRLVEQALTHRSAGQINNERLEFLGDSLVNFFVAEALYARFPNATEGEMSRMRAALVKGETLADIARELKLGDSLILGPGEMKSGGFRRDSILADALEALVAAIYLDAGLEACRQRTLAWYGARLESVVPGDVNKDPKTRLQELLQGRRQPLPRYELVDTSGEAHNQSFTVSCELPAQQLSFRGVGSNRRSAEQAAAAAALSHLSTQR